METVRLGRCAWVFHAVVIFIAFSVLLVLAFRIFGSHIAEIDRNLELEVTIQKSICRPWNSGDPDVIAGKNRMMLERRRRCAKERDGVSLQVNRRYLTVLGSKLVFQATS